MQNLTKNDNTRTLSDVHKYKFTYKTSAQYVKASCSSMIEYSQNLTLYIGDDADFHMVDIEYDIFFILFLMASHMIYLKY